MTRFGRAAAVGCVLSLLGQGVGGRGVAWAAQTSNKESAWAAYRRALGERCGGKHLELLSPGDLLDQAEGFKGTLTPDGQGEVEEAMDASCRGVTMNPSCNNAGFLQATARMGKMTAFAARMCALPERCTRQSVCEKTDK